MMNNIKKIVLTGATGFIGSNLCRHLDISKFDVYCIVRKSSDTTDLKDKNFHVELYEYVEDLYMIMKRIKPDILIHLAGVFASMHRDDNILSMIDCNLKFSTVVLDAAVQSGCKNAINTSSYWEHYNNREYYPVNLYAAMKKAFKDILDYYVRWEHLNVITLMIFDTYGYGDKRKKILNTLRDAAPGDEINMSEGRQKMYLCYIDDVCRAFIVAINMLLNDNLSEGSNNVEYAVKPDKCFTLKQIVNYFLEISRKNVIVNWNQLPYRRGEIMDPELIGKRLPGWSDTTDIITGISLFLGK